MASLLSPSVPTSSDYVEMGLLSAFIAVGIPITTYAFYRSLRQYVSSQSRSGPGRFVMLKLHLSAADMLIVYVYALSELIWLGTYRWMGGDVLCKAIKFSHLMSFYLTSNVVVCIALDRAYATFKIYRLRHQTKTYNTTKQMLRIAWIVAIVASLPQLFIWQTFQPYPKPHAEWTQCSSIWSVKQRLFILLYHQLIPGNLTQTDVDNLARLYQIEKIYSAAHVALVFWIPAAVILTCYGLIICKLQKSIDKTSGFSGRASAAGAGTAAVGGKEYSTFITGVRPFTSSTQFTIGAAARSPIPNNTAVASYCEITDCDFRTLNNSSTPPPDIDSGVVDQKNKSRSQTLLMEPISDKRKISRISSNGLLTASISPKNDLLCCSNGTTASSLSSCCHLLHDDPLLSSKSDSCDLSIKAVRSPKAIDSFSKKSRRKKSSHQNNNNNADKPTTTTTTTITKTRANSIGRKRSVSPNISSASTTPTTIESSSAARRLLGTNTNYRSFAAATLMRAKNKTLRKTALILLTYIVCWSPYNILALWKLVDQLSYQRVFENVIGNKMEFLCNLIVINAILNPLIYGFR